VVCDASVSIAEKLQKAKLQGTESRPVGNHKRCNCQKLAGLIPHSVNEEFLPDRGSFLPQMSPPKFGPKRGGEGSARRHLGVQLLPFGGDCFECIGATYN